MKKTLLATISLGLMSFSAQAVKINGSISFSGDGAFVSTTNPMSPNENNATGVVWVNNPQNVGAATFDYAPVKLQNDIATFTNFDFGVQGTVGALSVKPLWTITFGGITYAFELVSISSNEVQNSQRQLVGMGIATIINHPTIAYEPTEGTFEFSASSDTAEFTFSSSTSTVPDGGGTLTLFGLTLLAIPALRKRFSK